LSLLVVIAIIAILIALLLPLVIAAQRRANEVACQSNLRQLGIAMANYGTDYRFFPTAVFNTSRVSVVTNLAEAWPVRLRKYLSGNQKAFYCPAQDPRCQWTEDAPGPDIRAAWLFPHFGYREGERLLLDGQHPILAPGTFFSYGVNSSGTQGGLGIRGIGYTLYPFSDPNFSHSTTFGVYSKPFTVVRRPSEFILMADTAADGMWDLNIYPFLSTDPRTDGGPGTVHRGGANVLFADGHVKWFLRDEICVKYPYEASDAQKQRLWNADNKPFKDW
jgi:prepilin-type processing-associated H-X9-DG protein